MPPAYQNTLTFDQNFFNSRNNMHLNIVYWNSLQSKEAVLPTFSAQTPHVLGEKQKIWTNHLHHRKAGSVSLILSLRVGVQHIEKWCNIFVNALAVKYTLYLASLFLIPANITLMLCSITESAPRLIHSITHNIRVADVCSLRLLETSGQRAYR